jgi:hypothetical protein
MRYRFLADVVVALHAIFVGFVVLGLLAILIGHLLNWRWIGNLYFRLLHLAAVALVCGEALIGMDCPLTTMENALRIAGGQRGYGGDCIGYWLDRMIFYDLPRWVFLVSYLAFGALVVSTLWLAPLRREETE